MGMNFKTNIEIEWQSQTTAEAIKDLKLFESALKALSDTIKINIKQIQ